jgi:hypothetical protein
MPTIRLACGPLFALAVVALLARPAMAAPFTWEFTGAVSGSNQFGGSPLIDLMPLGTVVTFTVSFDSAAADLCGADNRGWFGLPSASVGFLGSSYAASSGGLEVSNPAGNCAGDGPDVPTQDYVQRLGFSAAPFGGGFLYWAASGDGDQAPSVLPASGGFQLNYACGVVCANGVYGSITEVRAVPEPAALSLLGVAVAAVAWRRGRSRP